MAGIEEEIGLEIDEKEVLVIVMAAEIPDTPGAKVLLDQRVHTGSTPRHR
jgi:hypothetical protein